MKVLVTGGAGYIGSIATARLLEEGHAVTVFDSLELGHRRAVDSRAAFIRGDLRREGEIDAALRESRPEAVMHFAAYALVGESMADPGRYFDNNVGGGVRLLEAMRRHGVRRMVFSSTCATYGHPAHVPIDESLPAEPVNPYGQSKLMFEQVLEWYARIHALHPVCLRYFNAGGADGSRGEDHRPETHLIPIVLQAALGRRECVVVHGDDYETPDGTCIRDYVHVADLAEAHVLALDTPHRGRFNLGTGQGVSVRRILDLAHEVTGRPVPFRIGPRRPGDPPVLTACADRARRQLGWRARRSEPSAILADAWTWHRAHPDGYGDDAG